MATEPVTDNERDAQTIREALDAAVALDNEWWNNEHSDAVAAFARLVAALSAATTERDEWKHDYYRDVAAHYDAKIAAERRADALAAQLQQAREALSWALNSLELAFKRLDSVDEYSPEHYLIRQAGFDKARAALAAAAPATTEAKP